MIVVTAAAGRTGTAVVRALRDRGLAVRAVVGHDRARPGLAALGAEVAVADLRRSSAVLPLLSDAAASDYFDAYQKVLRGKWKSLEVAGHDPRRFNGKSEDGYFSVALDGTHVLSEEGFASPL